MSLLSGADVRGWVPIGQLPAQWNPGETADGMLPERIGTILILASPGGAAQQRVAFVGPASGDTRHHAGVLLGTMNAALLHNDTRKLGPTLRWDGTDGRLMLKAYEGSRYNRWHSFITRVDAGYVMIHDSGWRLPKDAPAQILQMLELHSASKNPGVDRSLRFPVEVPLTVNDRLLTKPRKPPIGTFSYDRLDKTYGVILRVNMKHADGTSVGSYVAQLASVQVVAESPVESSFSLFVRTQAKDPDQFAGYNVRHVGLTRADAQRILIAWDVLCGGAS